MRLAVSDAPAEINWIYALVAPFPTVKDGISGAELRAAWQGDAPQPWTESTLWMTTETKAALSAFWGQASSKHVRTAAADQLLDLAWAEKDSWAIIPFEEIEPRWKVLQIDGDSPLHNDFDAASYPLVIPFGWDCQSSCEPPALSASNRDPNKLTVLIMSGVTALVRATALKMETEGITYPARDIGDILRNADITHISNEIPFTPYCPYPNPNPGTQPFCSNPKYIELLEYVGMDVVELTGNHFQDHGSAATLYTLDMYDERDIPYYGGGRNLADAIKPITLEHNGNKIAFIGCNPVGPDYAWAREDDWPGAAPCDYDYLTEQIGALRDAGYLPIATFQYFEYYSPEIRPWQGRDFRALADAGAIIVSGSQAHFAQAKEFYKDSFIDYGLGNLFFDQMHTAEGTRNEFLDRHVFYDGRYLGVELLTNLLEDYARPRPMTEPERTEFLTYIFNASGWGDLVATLTPTPTTTPRPVEQ
jgi:poly-gamma-glutamate synthesis protein (capsule biosynthesis protein)